MKSSVLKFDSMSSRLDRSSMWPPASERKTQRDDTHLNGADILTGLLINKALLPGYQGNYFHINVIIKSA